MMAEPAKTNEATSVRLDDTLPPTPWDELKRRAIRHPGLLIGLFLIALALVLAVFSPLIATHDPYAQDLTKKLLPPFWSEGGSAEHLFGTDSLGRDFFSRIVYGAQVTMIVGFGATLMSGIIGSALGIVGGYYGGRVDTFVMFIVNVKLAMPGILIALSLVSIFGGSLLVITLILGFLFWDRFAVVVRSATQQIRAYEFITAAEVAGATRMWIMFREILPNVMNQIIVVASLEMAIAILVEASLSFLGLGIQPPTPSWGLLVSEGRTFMFFKPYLIMLPGAAIFLLVVGINLAGDGLRDVTAPEGRS